MAEHQGVRFTVSGMVQGVGFRYFVERVARSLGLVGYVRNLYDGSVEVYAEGDRARLELLGGRLRKGPSYARVDEVREEWGDATGKYDSFRITF